MAILLCGSYLVPAQASEDGFRRVLREKAGFSESDLSELDNGFAVIKFLPVHEKREMGVCGIVRLQKTSEISIAAFRDSVSPKNNRSMLGGGDFSKPPVFDDLKSLKLDKRDIEDMKKCVAGNCGLKMSAAMITKLQSEVDLNSPDAKERATQWFRQAIFNYVKDYSERGNDALMVFNDKKTPTRLADEHKELLDESLFIDYFAPEFAKYLSNYPGFRLPDVDDNLIWSNITFGFKPTITVVHVMAYTHIDQTAPQYLMATKQIYGSHYIDSSLVLSMLVNVPANGSTNTYLIFTNISRSDSLTGALGGVKRSLIGTEATQHVKDILKFAKARLESNPADREKPDSRPDDGTLQHVWILAGNPIVQVLSVFVFGGLLVALYALARKLRS